MPARHSRTRARAGDSRFLKPASSLMRPSGLFDEMLRETFRDYLAKGESKAAMADFFDFEEATRTLGDEFVILVRGHAFNARSRHRVGSDRGVVDVTDYPEVSDL